MFREEAVKMVDETCDGSQNQHHIKAILRLDI